MAVNGAEYLDAILNNHHPVPQNQDLTEKSAFGPRKEMLSTVALKVAIARAIQGGGGEGT